MSQSVLPCCGNPLVGKWIIHNFNFSDTHAVWQGGLLKASATLDDDDELGMQMQNLY